MTLPQELSDAIGAYDTWIDAELQKQQKANTIKETLYHYTNVAGLRGIFESESIWFTDFRHLNDPSEIIHGIEMCHDVIRNIKIGADGRAALFLDCLADMMTSANFSKALEYFIGSFSRARDDLGQWRAYADNGRGVAIGFAPHLFGIESTIDQKPDETAFVGPVIYDIGQVCSQHDAAIQQAAEIFLNTANVHREVLANKDIGITFMQDFARAVIASPLIWNCLASKHPAYAHEQEVRLIILGLHDKLMPYIQTRIRGSEIVPYIPYKMAVRKEHSIGEIIIGPAANVDAERAVRTMLESLGIEHDIPISRSLVPYRAV
jgi:hypothetical protein